MSTRLPQGGLAEAERGTAASCHLALVPGLGLIPVGRCKAYMNAVDGLEKKKEKTDGGMSVRSTCHGLGQGASRDTALILVIGLKAGVGLRLGQQCDGGWSSWHATASLLWPRRCWD